VCILPSDNLLASVEDDLSSSDSLLILVCDDLLLGDDCFSSEDRCFSIFGDSVSAEDRLTCLDDLYTWECILPSDILLSVSDDFLLGDDCFSSVDSCFSIMGDDVSAKDGLFCLYT
jgi:hypothetical protein